MNQESNKISLQHRVKVSPDVVFRILDGEAVLLNLQSGVYFGLNETGTNIWNILSENGSLEHVYTQLLHDYAVDPELAKNDVLNLTEQLIQKGLVTVSPLK